jgi:hypothetical protein
LRYGPVQLKLRGFSWKLGITHFVAEATRHHASSKPGGFAYQARLHA